MNKKVCPICRYVDDNGATYCRDCGAKMVEENAEDMGGGYGYSYQNDAYGSSYQQADPSGGTRAVNGLQVACLVCGILSICSCCCYGLPSLVLGIVGIICASKGSQAGRNSVGTAGFICSVIGLIMGVMSLLGWMLFSFAGSGDWEYFMRQFMDRV